MVSFAGKALDEQKITKINIFLIRYANLIILSITILFLVGGFFYFLKPKYNEIMEKIKVSNDNKKEVLDALTNYMSSLNRYNTAYANISTEDRIVVDKIMPGSERAEDLFIDFEKIIRDAGFKLLSLDIEKSKDSGSSGGDEKKKKLESLTSKDGGGIPGVAETKLKLSIQGSGYANFKKLLKALESNMRLIDVQAVDFSGSSDSIDLEVSIYNFNQKTK